LIHDLIKSSEESGEIKLSDGMFETLMKLRTYMFENVYVNSIAKTEEGKAQALVRRLFEYYVSNTEKLPAEYVAMIEKGSDEKERVVCDFIAGMTDNYAVKTYTELAIPQMWSVY
jgi:dGTPase